MKYTPPLGEAENASYTDGNPEYGILGSVVPAKAVESPQREVVKVIQEAGLTPSDNDLTQLLQAIIKIIGVKVPLAKVGTPGIMSPDDKTCTVDAKGVLSVLLATAARAGIIKPDGTSLTVDKNGVLSVIQKADATVTELDFLRKLSIGRPVWHTSTTLPDRHMWVNGDLIDFDAHPEFGEKFEAGGFAGLVMPWDADAKYQAAHLGQFRPNSANPSAVFSPLHGGQFFRAWVLGASESAGSWGRDEIRNITGAVAELFGQQDGGATGAMQISLLNNRAAVTGSGAGYGRVSFDASNGVPTGPLNVPPHVWQPVAIYLGRPK